MRRRVGGLELMEGFDEALGPVAADDLRDGEEGTPIVGEAIDDFGRHHRVAGGDGGVVVVDPAGDLAPEGDFEVGVAPVESGTERAGGSPGQANDYGALGQRGSELAYAGQSGGGIGFEEADVGSFAARGATVEVVSGVNEAAQVGILIGIGVEFIQDESWLVLMRDAEEDRRSEVVGAQNVGAQAGDEIEGGSFSATRLGGGDVEAWRMGKGFDGVRVTGPEGEHRRCTGREEEVVQGAVVDLVEQGHGVGDRFHPGLQAADGDGVGVGIGGRIVGGS